MSTRGLSLRTFPSWITIFLFAKKSFSDGKLFTCVSQSVLIMKEDIKGIQGRKGRWGMCCIAESMTGDLLYLFWSQQPGDVSPWCSCCFHTVLWCPRPKTPLLRQYFTMLPSYTFKHTIWCQTIVNSESNLMMNEKYAVLCIENILETQIRTLFTYHRSGHSPNLWCCSRSDSITTFDK